MFIKNKIFVGKLSPDTTEESLTDVFSKFGDVTKVDLQRGFAFITFEDAGECDEARKHMDGQEVDGSIIVVQQARSSKETMDFKDGKTRPVKRMDLRVTATGIDSHVSWQDLKDWARFAGEVTFTNVFSRDHQTVGVIEFAV